MRRRHGSDDQAAFDDAKRGQCRVAVVHELRNLASTKSNAIRLASCELHVVERVMNLRLVTNVKQVWHSPLPIMIA